MLNSYVFGMGNGDFRPMLVIIPVAAFFLFKRYFALYPGNRLSRVRINK